MATLSLSCTPATASPGQTVTLQYTVTGADDVPPSTTTTHVDGTTVVDGQTLPASVDLSVTRPGVTHTKVYNAPTSSGLSNVTRDATDPSKFTATVL